MPVIYQQWLFIAVFVLGAFLFLHAHQLVTVLRAAFSGLSVECEFLQMRTNEPSCASHCMSLLVRRRNMERASSSFCPYFTVSWTLWIHDTWKRIIGKSTRGAMNLPREIHKQWILKMQELHSGNCFWVTVDHYQVWAFPLVKQWVQVKIRVILHGRYTLWDKIIWIYTIDIVSLSAGSFCVF